MQSLQAHPLQPQWDNALAAVRSDALATALELGVFDELSPPASAATLAQRRQWDERSTARLLELLCAMGLLAATGAPATLAYRPSALAQRYLMRSSPDYCGRAYIFRVRSLQKFGGQLASFVQTGQASAPWFGASPEPWAAAAQEHLAEEQRALTAAAARAIAEGVPEFGAARRFLDIGGGPGIVAIALAGLNTELTGTVFELPSAADVARQNIHAAGLDARLNAVGGNLATDPLGGPYDFIWCSSVLHFVPDLHACLNKIRKALSPRGVFVCAHAELPREGEPDLTVHTYYLPLLMRGLWVAPRGEMLDTLKGSGFERVEQFERRDFPIAPLQVLVARRGKA